MISNTKYKCKHKYKCIKHNYIYMVPWSRYWCLIQAHYYYRWSATPSERPLTGNPAPRPLLPQSIRSLGFVSYFRSFETLWKRKICSSQSCHCQVKQLFVFRRRARLEHKDSVVPDKVLLRCKRRVVLFFSVSRLKARRLGGLERGAEGVQTWDLSKNLHDRIFGPKILHSKNT